MNATAVLFETVKFLGCLALCLILGYICVGLIVDIFKKILGEDDR